MVRRMAWALLVGAVVVACGSSTDPATFGATGASGTTTTGGEPGSGGAAPLVCAPGKQEACPCVNGAQGAQACADDGASWGECVCPTVGGAGQGGAATGGAGGASTSSGMGGAAGAGGAATTSTTSTGSTTTSTTGSGGSQPADAGAPDADAPPVCGSDSKLCNGVCTLMDEHASCGDPNTCAPCSAPFAASYACGIDQCIITACAKWHANCDGLYANGCEVNVGADANNCGVCNSHCLPGGGCQDGKCVP